MKHLITRAYAAQRLISYRRDMLRRRSDFASDAMWSIISMTAAVVFLMF